MGNDFRLKKHNAGAIHSLNSDDLLIANYTPMPQADITCKVKLIVNVDGNIEYAEYVKQARSPSQFHHHVFSLDIQLREYLNRMLQDLGKAYFEIGFNKIDCDMYKYEAGLPLRAIRFKSDDEDICASLLLPSFFNDYNIDQQQSTKYSELFESIWSCLFDAVKNSEYDPTIQTISK